MDKLIIGTKEDIGSQICGYLFDGWEIKFVSMAPQSSAPGMLDRQYFKMAVAVVLHKA